MTMEEMRRGLLAAIDRLATDALLAQPDSVASKIVQPHIRFLCNLMDKVEADEATSSTRTITVILSNGQCVNVKNLPGAWLYDVETEQNIERGE